MKERLKTGLVGAGVFASYHGAKIHASTVTDFSGICDRAHNRGIELAKKYATTVFDTLDKLLDASDAIIIASPAHTHFALGKQALEAGCHVLLEKPLALSVEEAKVLADLADEKGLILQVGHQERLVCKALGLFEIPERPVSIEIARVGPPPQDGRSMDVSVIWDLMIHDIDLVHALVAGDIHDAQCKGRTELDEHFDMAIAHYAIDDTDIRLTASRIAPDRERRMVLGYRGGHIALDFLDRTIENTTSFTIADNLADLVPDPLGAADEIFFKACIGHGAPLMTGLEAVKAVATADLLSELALKTED